MPCATKDVEEYAFTAYNSQVVRFSPLLQRHDQKLTGDRVEATLATALGGMKSDFAFGADYSVNKQTRFPNGPDADVSTVDPFNYSVENERMATAKKTAAKTVTKTTRGRNQDRTLVATMEDYEVKYLATKHTVTQKAVKDAVAKVGHSRNKVEAELKRGKATTAAKKA